MRRSRLIAYLIALVTLLSGALIFTTPSASADTATPEIEYEGWFARNAPPAPQVDIPCEVAGNPIPRPPTGTGCGPTSVTGAPTPQSKTTGHYVVASAGGNAGDDSATSGDTGWAAFRWDLSDQFGATVDKFVVTLAQGTDNSGQNQGDTYPRPQPEPPPIQACNALEPWAAGQGSNPWDGRPTDSTECVVPTTETKTTTTDGTDTTTHLFTFDVTSMARSWLESDPRGYGFVIRPGRPDKNTELDPFQITFSGYYDTDTTNATTGRTTYTTKPKVDFRFTPPIEEDFGEDFEDIDAGEDEFFEDVVDSDDSGDVLEALPDLDVIPTDEGSEPFPEEEIADVPVDVPVTDIAAPTRTRPISRDTGFPWIVLLLLPLVAVAFWGTGTALGPVGDPVPARQGGVSRVLAQRQAANGGFDLHTRY